MAPSIGPMTLHTPGTTIKFRVTRLYIPDIASPITAAGTVILTIKPRVLASVSSTSKSLPILAGMVFCFRQYWMVYRYHGVPPYLRAPKGGGHSAAKTLADIWFCSCGRPGGDLVNATQNSKSWLRAFSSFCHLKECVPPPSASGGSAETRRCMFLLMRRVTKHHATAVSLHRGALHHASPVTD
jgi:hypothetical protein